MRGVPGSVPGAGACDKLQSALGSNREGVTVRRYNDYTWHLTSLGKMHINISHTGLTVSEHNSVESELVELKKKIESKLREYGSLELVARLIYVEMVTLPGIGNTNPLREKPFLLYLLGLLLTNNNLNAGKPSREQITEILDLLDNYLNKFYLSLLHLTTQHKTPHDFIKFSVDQLKIENDLDLGSYLNQKDEYYRQVFAPLDQHFRSKYGFTVKCAHNYVDAITKTILKEMSQLDPRSDNMADVLTINTNDFCDNHNIGDKKYV